MEASTVCSYTVLIDILFSLGLLPYLIHPWIHSVHLLVPLHSNLWLCTCV